DRLLGAPPAAAAGPPAALRLRSGQASPAQPRNRRRAGGGPAGGPPARHLRHPEHERRDLMDVVRRHSTDVTLIDSPVANVANIARALQAAGAELRVTRDAREIEGARK